MVSTRIQLPASLKEAGFREARKSKHQRIIMNVKAMEKCGKSRLALTAPGPIGYISLEYGLEGVVEGFIDQGKTIWPAFFKTSHAIRYLQDTIKSDEWLAELESVEKAMIAVVTNEAVRTAVIDTGTEHWELVRLGEFGKVSQVMADQYGPANKRMRNIIEIAYQRPDLNLIVLSKMGKRYVKTAKSPRGDWDGTYEYKGWGDLPYIVQANVLLWREENEDTGFQDFCCQVENTRFDEGQRSLGVVLKNSEINFQNIAMMLRTNSSPEDWEDVG